MFRALLLLVDMRKFNDGDHIVVEPFRAASFCVIRDLAIARSALDRIIGAGHIKVNCAAPDANLIPVPTETADTAFDAAACNLQATQRLLPHRARVEQSIERNVDAENCFAIG